MAKKADKPSLREAIDRLGVVRAKLHALGFIDKALTASIRDALEKRKGKTADGERFHAELIEQVVYAVDIGRLKRAAGKKFLDCIRADMRAARKVLGSEKLEKIADASTKHQLRVTERATRARPIRHPGRKAG